jgi:hypothetical protein
MVQPGCFRDDDRREPKEGTLFWPQLVCAISLLGFGGLMLVMASRAMYGKVVPPWFRFTRRGPAPRKQPTGQEMMIFIVLSIITSTISLLGGLGFLMLIFL